MPRKYFEIYEIRGTMGKSHMTPDFVPHLGHAVGCVLHPSEQRPTMLIGKGTSASGYMRESALESGLNSAGVDMVLPEPLPTLGVAYVIRALRANLGLFIRRRWWEPCAPTRPTWVFRSTVLPTVCTW